MLYVIGTRRNTRIACHVGCGDEVDNNNGRGDGEDIRPIFPRCTSSASWFPVRAKALCEVRKAIYQSSLPTPICHLYKSLLERV